MPMEAVRDWRVGVVVVTELIVVTIRLRPIWLPFGGGLAVPEYPLGNEVLHWVSGWRSDRHKSKKSKNTSPRDMYLGR